MALPRVKMPEVLSDDERVAVVRAVYDMQGVTITPSMAYKVLVMLGVPASRLEVIDYALMTGKSEEELAKEKPEIHGIDLRTILAWRLSLGDPVPADCKILTL